MGPPEARAPAANSPSPSATGRSFPPLAAEVAARWLPRRNGRARGPPQRLGDLPGPPAAASVPPAEEDDEASTVAELGALLAARNLTEGIHAINATTSAPASTPTVSLGPPGARPLPSTTRTSGAAYRHRPTPLSHPSPILLAAYVRPEDIDAVLRVGEHQHASVHDVLVSRSELRRRQEVPIALAGRRYDGPMRLELDTWGARGEHEEVAYDGQHVISTRWVLTQKPGELPSDADKLKARLCVRGFEDPHRRSVVSWSPTAGRASVRVLLGLFADRGYVPRSVDVRTAFLQGMPIERMQPVYVQPPPQAKAPAGVVWELRKCAYGLMDAPRWWYQTVCALMERLGYDRAESDHGLFLHHADEACDFGLATHVDDFLYGGITQEVARFEHELMATFDTGPVAVGDLTFTGLRLRTTVSSTTGAVTIRVDQDHFLDTIEPIILDAARLAQKEAMVTTGELTLYRRAVGALLSASGQTQPFMSAASSLLPRRFHQAVVNDLTSVNRVINVAQAAKGLPRIFSPLAPPHRLILFTEASSITLASATAQTGYHVFLARDTGTRGELKSDTELVLLAWGSHRQRRVTHSSIAAETYALLDGMRSAVEVACLLALAVGGPDAPLIPIDAILDCLSLFNTLSSTSLIKPKEVNAGVASLREVYSSECLSSATWTPAGGQLAHCLTKASSSSALRTTLRTGRYGFRPAGTITKTYATDRSDLDEARADSKPAPSRILVDAGEEFDSSFIFDAFASGSAAPSGMAHSPASPSSSVHH